MGKVKSVDTVLQGTEQQIREETLECLKQAAPGGRYILSNDCAVPRDTRASNIRAMWEVWRDCGKYPLGF
jgi:uroporphyrinogen decarboxylase